MMITLEAEMHRKSSGTYTKQCTRQENSIGRNEMRADENRPGWWQATTNWMRGGLAERSGVPRIGVALGGGLARGFAHMGVLRALEKNNMPIHAVAGVSAGAMVAAALAGGSSADEIQQIALSMKFRRRSIRRPV